MHVLLLPANADCSGWALRQALSFREILSSEIAVQFEEGKIP
jgi:hypothetical protein